MTTPYERARAIRKTEMFLKDLLNSSNYQGVPEEMREIARGLLRHYPGLNDLQVIEESWTNPIMPCPLSTKDSVLGNLK